MSEKFNKVIEIQKNPNFGNGKLKKAHLKHSM
jgi:hypothetical protein